MPTLLILSDDDARRRAHLTGSLGRRHRLVDAVSWAGVPTLMERDDIHGVLVDASMARRLPFGELAWLRRQHVGVATVVLVDPRGRELELFRLGRLGVDGIVLDTPTNGTPQHLREALERALARAAGRRVAARLAGHAPSLLVEGVAWAVAHAHSDPGPADLARSTARSLRAFRRELRRAQLPSPSRILLWGRLLRAAHLLDRDDRAVEPVAHKLGYSTASSLSRALRRETGLPPSEIRNRGGVTCVLDALLKGPDLPPRWPAAAAARGGRKVRTGNGLPRQ